MQLIALISLLLVLNRVNILECRLVEAFLAPFHGLRSFDSALVSAASCERRALGPLLLRLCVWRTYNPPLDDAPCISVVILNI